MKLLRLFDMGEAFGKAAAGLGVFFFNRSDGIVYFHTGKTFTFTVHSFKYSFFRL